jgi:hypothetical protein
MLSFSITTSRDYPACSPSISVMYWVTDSSSVGVLKDLVNHPGQILGAFQIVCGPHARCGTARAVGWIAALAASCSAALLLAAVQPGTDPFG